MIIMLKMLTEITSALTMQTVIQPSKYFSEILQLLLFRKTVINSKLRTVN